MCFIIELLGVRLWKCGSIEEGSADRPIFTSWAAAPASHPLASATVTTRIHLAMMSLRSSCPASFRPGEPDAEARMSRLQTTAEILAALVGFDTTSRNSNLAVVAWIEDYLDRLGVVHERVADGSETRPICGRPSGLPGRAATSCPAIPTWFRSTARPGPAIRSACRTRDGRLYGRGSADMKGFLACCLAAVPAMRDLARPIHLSFSHDEEVGCVGVRSLIAHLGDSGVRPAACFVGEPTAMAVVIGHKGKRSFRVDVRGRTCHSSLAPAGVNAVEYAARLIVRIRDLADRLAREGKRDPLYDVPFTTAHTGVVQGGTALNIVPDAASFQFEFRPLASDDVGALADEVMAYARERLEPEMKAIAPEAGFSVQVDFRLSRARYAGRRRGGWVGEVAGGPGRPWQGRFWHRSRTVRASRHRHGGDRPGLDRAGAQGR